jgi:murein DD-endopeptidase MepM/ murein hydrolase activator NlpD
VIRLLALTAVGGLMISGAGVPTTPRAPAVAPASVVSYAAPVRAPVQVVHPFATPADPYAAGERGVDLAAEPGQSVFAAADGVVAFAGSIAGRGVVVLRHADGVSTEYEPLRVVVRAGASLARGVVLGYVAGTHRGCAPERCLHWGARREGRYFDPMSLLRPLGPVRLLPWTS